MAVEIRVLGRVDAVVDGRSLPLKGRKQRAVLAMLALRANRTVAADELIDGLWGERPPASATTNLQYYVSQLRKVLASDDSGARIVTHGRGYELQLPQDAVDAVRFEHLVERARREGEPTGRRRARSSSGAAPLSPTSRKSRSPDLRSAASRSFTCARSSLRSTPSSPRGDTPR
jgi:DNA-binding SARP family transcriptional activator